MANSLLHATIQPDNICDLGVKGDGAIYVPRSPLYHDDRDDDQLQGWNYLTRFHVPPRRTFCLVQPVLASLSLCTCTCTVGVLHIRAAHLEFSVGFLLTTEEVVLTPRSPQVAFPLVGSPVRREHIPIPTPLNRAPPFR